MPEFSAPITIEDHPFVNAYALSIAAPWIDPELSPPLMTAYIVPEVPDCRISEALAKQYDPQIDEGELLFLTIVEEKAGGVVHQYPLAFPVRFARTSRPDYVHISLDHLLLMFDIAEYEPREGESAEARRLDLRLRRCVEHRVDQADEDFSEVE